MSDVHVTKRCKKCEIEINRERLLARMNKE